MINSDHSLHILLLVRNVMFFFSQLSLGYFVAGRLTKPKKLLLLHAFAIMCLVSYATFFIFLRWPQTGSAVSTVIVSLGVISLVPNAIFIYKHKSVSKQCLLLPVLLWMAVASFYGLFLSSCETKVKVPTDHYRNYCITQPLPADNILPQYFADNILTGHSQKKFSSWNMYDRPPLQSAVVMTTVSPFNTYGIDDYSYFVLAVLLQTIWVPILWLLIPELTLASPRQRYFIMASMVFAGFFFINSIFTWPKLMAAIFVIAGYYYLFSIKRSPKRSAYAGLLSGLGFLSHGGVVFTIPPMLLVYLFRGPGKKVRPRLLDIVAFIVSFMAVYLPWGWYKAVTAKGGDRLIKQQLAGTKADDTNGTVPAIVDAYKHTSFSAVINDKLSNLAVLFYNVYNKTYEVSGIGLVLDYIRAQSFYVTFFALGIYNFGWFYYLRSLASKETARERRTLDTIAMVCMLSLGFWVLAMFLPGSTIIHQGSYATMTLLFLALSTKLSKHLSALWLAIILCLQAVILSIVWTINAAYTPDNYLSPSHAALSGVLGAGLLYWFIRGTKKKSVR